MEINLTNIFTQEEITPEIQSFVDTLIDEVTEGVTYYYTLKIAGNPVMKNSKKASLSLEKQ